MLCKNRITLIGFLGRHAERRFTANGTTYTRFSIATSVSWKVKETFSRACRVQDSLSMRTLRK
jgi:single-strand DNA-binding protein